MSAPLNLNTDDGDVPIEPNLEEYVQTLEFDRQCSEKARDCAALFPRALVDSDEDILSSSDDSVPGGGAVECAAYEVPRIEANLYYAGVGPRGRGPRLVYRTSDDRFEEPCGPEAYKRLMRAVAVPDSHEFGQDGLWDAVRDQVVKLLNERNVKVSSVDFVRFTWLNKMADQEIKEEEEEEEEEEEDDSKEEEDFTYDDIPLIQPVEYGERYYTNPTIWIGVLPGTLTGAVAHESSKDIRTFLDSLRVQNVDVAYRESVCKTLRGHGPALFRPVEGGDPLKDVIDNVSVSLSLPIAGRKTTMQGTLGPYFRVGDKLYAITVRHNVFLPNGDNELYEYHESAPKKEVLLMRARAFTHYLTFIQALIGTHIDSLEPLERKIGTLGTRVRDGIDVQVSQTKLDENEAELAKTRTKIHNLKKFFVDVKKRWSRSQDRAIGFVRWAPPIGAGVAPHRYTRDLCVIELYKEKFKHMVGNVLSLGPEASPSKLKALMCERVGVPSKFKYPDDGLLALRGVLTVDQLTNPPTSDLQGARTRRILKRGCATSTTVGTLTRFVSFARRYFPTGNLDSLEVPVLSHEHDSGAFAGRGDSGSLVVSARGEFMALLTGGTGKGTYGSDIAFATPFEWVWDFVKAEFPDADLCFDSLQEFLADVA